MTTVTIVPLTEGYLFECSGHAGYGDGDHDIVCAGASALCMALEAMAEGMADEGRAVIRSKHAADGYFSLEIAPEPEEDLFARERLRTVMETVAAGFAAIEEGYGEYLRCEG